jgi:ADP-heptose:LPS heptosyltransferase
MRRRSFRRLGCGRRRHVFKSAERDATECGLSELQEKLPIVDLASLLQDFRETAALMMQLDLIITVDTATAHLAGALGRPVWTLLCHTPDWRWHLEQADSPWYPTMRLFRQPSWGDWSGVIEDVVVALKK